MKNKIIENSIAEWIYNSNETLKTVESMPPALWEFSPHPKFSSFTKQVRHVIGCRGVFADGFFSGSVNFDKKHSFYTGDLSRESLIQALKISTQQVQSVLEKLTERNLTDYSTDYYGEKMGYIEHFSALVCHEALHRGQWSIYIALATDQTEPA